MCVCVCVCVCAQLLRLRPRLLLLLRHLLPSRWAPSPSQVLTLLAVLVQNWHKSTSTDAARGPVTSRPFTTTTLKWGALVDTKMPSDWVSGAQFDREAPLAGAY